MGSTMVRKMVAPESVDCVEALAAFVELLLSSVLPPPVLLSAEHGGLPLGPVNPVLHLQVVAPNSEVSLFAGQALHGKPPKGP